MTDWYSGRVAHSLVDFGESGAFAVLFLYRWYLSFVIPLPFLCILKAFPKLSTPLVSVSFLLWIMLS